MRGGLYTPIARVRTPLMLAGIALEFAHRWYGLAAPLWAGRVMIAAGLVLFFVPVRRKGTAEPVTVRPPVQGRWVPVNSPADRVPSHGTHELGQTYAIDLVHQPDGDWRALHAWPPARRPRAFPAFGRPVLAPADGVVVRASGWQRDHWSRNSYPAFVFLLLEGFARQVLSFLALSGARFVLGNHVILDIGGTYALLAHLQRGSLEVRKGQRVLAGQQIARCGNSGNTSEPHLHFHLMDLSTPLIAAGVPFAFPYEDAGEARRGVPGARRPFTAPARPLT